ncbi:MAG: T9SS type A sorting domain-containing protein [Crocinitomicaceae bacterium]|nr:T9SS type A sorting domain-containing protein [Crocinitomicaceae bacterium]
MLIVGVVNISMNLVVKVEPPKPPTPTYYEDISPIIYNHCTKCHRTGEIGPMPLSNISEVTAYGAMVKYVTGIKYMPPWKADPDYRHFLDENVLTDAEIQTIADWYDGGMPAGDPLNEAAMPNFPTGSVLGTPDVVVSMDQMYAHQGTNQDHYQVFVLDPGVTQVEEVKAIEFRAGNATICHHAVIGMDTTNQADALDAADPAYGYEMYGGFGFSPTEFAYQIWAPGQTPRFFPPGMSKKIYPNSKILLQMHYAPSPVLDYDSSHINLFFAQTAAPRYVQTVWMSQAHLTVPFQIPPDQVVSFKGSYTVPVDVSLLSIMPHAHLVGKSWLAYSVSSQGDTTQLIKIDDWDFNYQYRYAFQNLVKITAGSTVYVEATYDNTSSNPTNPNSPPQWVFFGDNTADEMFYCFFDYVPYQAGDENLQLSTEEGELTVPLTKIYPIFPNPANGNIKMGFSLAEGEKITLGIYDMSGKRIEIIEKNKFYPKGRSTIDYNVSGLASGTYFFGIRYRGQDFTEKFVVSQ